MGCMCPWVMSVQISEGLFKKQRPPKNPGKRTMSVQKSIIIYIYVCVCVCVCVSMVFKEGFSSHYQEKNSQA